MHQVQTVGDQSNDQNTDQKAAHRTGAAEEGGTAQYCCRNCICFITFTGSRLSGCQTGCQYHAAEACQRSADTPYQDLDFLYIDTGETGRYLVSANCVNVTSCLGLVQEQEIQDQENNHVNHRKRDRSKRTLADSCKCIISVCSYRRSVCYQISGTTADGLHSQSNYEGMDPGVRYDKAIQETDHKTDQNTKYHCNAYRHAPPLECSYRHNAAERRQCASGQIDTCKNDSHLYTDCQITVGCAGSQQIQQVLLSQEVFTEDREDHDQNSQSG